MDVQAEIAFYLEAVILKRFRILHNRTPVRSITIYKRFCFMYSSIQISGIWYLCVHNPLCHVYKRKGNVYLGKTY